MPRATTTREPPPVPVVDPPPPPPMSAEEEADDQEFEDIEAVIGQVGDEGATVTIRRRNPEERTKWDYLTTLAARDFSLELVKREFGGGEYKVTPFDRNKRFVRGGTRTFNIDKMFKPISAAPVATAPQQVPPEIAALTARIDALAAALTAQNSAKEQLDMALKIATVMKGDSHGGLSPDAVFGTATRLIEFSRGLGGENGGGGEKEDDDVYAAAVRELVKPVAALITSEIERRKGGATPSQPPKQLPPGNTEGKVAGAPWAAALAPFVPQLLTLAKENADTVLYADVVYDMMRRRLSAQALEAVEDAAAKEDFVPSIIAALPGPCKPFTDWFRLLAGHLKEAMTAPPNASEDDDEEGDGAGSPG